MMTLARRILLLACMASIPAVYAQDSSSDMISVDPEQQQLEWCFNYSNLLGYNISYVANPRVYKTVSDWLGTPYRYSGNGKNGIDCSSFVCRVYAEAYSKPIDGSSRDLFEAAVPVKKSELREGDLVFFKINKPRISHVGLYLGQNKFAHSSLQKGVIVSDLSDPYYSKYFYKGGRLNK